MKHRRLVSALAAAVLAASGLVVAAPAAGAGEPSPAAGRTPGTRSLAAVLAADGHGFDRNARDFDLVDRLVNRVLAAKPGSRLRILAEGDRRVTVFLPTDGAFRRAAAEIVGRRFKSERRVYRALWRAGGLDGAENVLLHHLVRGRPLTYHRLRVMAPTALITVQGGTLRVRVRDGRLVVLDLDPVSPNSRVFWGLRNINKGNRQIAHGVRAMLSPVTV